MLPDKEQTLELLIRAKYPLLYIISSEERRVEELLRAVATKRHKQLFSWTVTDGIADISTAKPVTINGGARDPLQMLEAIGNSKESAIFVLKDLHPFLDTTRAPLENAIVIRKLRDVVNRLKESRKTLILLSPILTFPAELEKDITVLDYTLPSNEELLGALDRVIRSAKAAERNGSATDLDLDEEQTARILRAAQGLTCTEAENAFSKSLIMHRKLNVDVIISEKRHLIQKSGVMEFFAAQEDFEDVGGMDGLKEWLRKRGNAFSERARRFGLPEPKGLLLLGVSGSGKSLIAKAVANQWHLPLLRLDMGRVFGELVGASEQNMRQALRLAESVAPCVTGDTRITLADGSERTIASLYEDLPRNLAVLAMTPDLELGTTRVRLVTRRPPPDLYQIKLRHASLRATSNHLHPVLRDGELAWVRTDALKRGDYVAFPRIIPTRAEAISLYDHLPQDTRLYGAGVLNYARKEFQTPQRRYRARVLDRSFVRVKELNGTRPALISIASASLGRGGTTDSTLRRIPETLSEELGYLLGLITSDGYMTRNRIGFVNTELALHQNFSEILGRQFDLTPSLRLTNARSRNNALKGTSENSQFRPCYVSYTSNLLLFNILNSIRTQLLSLPIPFLRAWLRGQFDGDGYVSTAETANPKVTITSKIPKHNLVLRSALQRVGFPSTNPDSANIEITGIQNVLRFSEEIGSWHPAKCYRLAQWKQQPVSEPKDRTDLIPIGGLLRKARQKLGLGIHHFRSTSSSLISSYERNLFHPNRTRLKSILDELKAADSEGAASAEIAAIEKVVDAPIGWTRVQSVKPDERPDYVYDLVCDDPHTFIANGLVTHNCVLWLDELDKGLAGTASSNRSDAGTAARVFATFLTWMQEKTAPVFTVATANDIQSLPPETLRKGRFDEIFFVDLPNAAERAEIWAIHLRKRNRPLDRFNLPRLAEETDGFSGAEIEQAILSAMYDAFDEEREVEMPDVLRNIEQTIPLSQTMREQVELLRSWGRRHGRLATSAVEEM